MYDMFQVALKVKVYLCMRWYYCLQI